MRKSSLVAVCALGALLLSVPAYSANYKSGSGGQAYFPADGSCFARDPYGRLKQTCSGQRYWTIDVETASTGSKTFKAFGISNSGTGSNETTCAAIVLANDGSLDTWTAHQKLNTTASWKTLGTLTVGAEENVQFECFISNAAVAVFGSGFVSDVTGF